MTSIVFTAEKLQIGAGSGYFAEIGSALICADLGIVPNWSRGWIMRPTSKAG